MLCHCAIGDLQGGNQCLNILGISLGFCVAESWADFAAEFQGAHVAKLYGHVESIKEDDRDYGRLLLYSPVGPLAMRRWWEYLERLLCSDRLEHESLCHQFIVQWEAMTRRGLHVEAVVCSLRVVQLRVTVG